VPDPARLGPAVEHGAEVSSITGKTLNDEADNNDDVKEVMCSAFSYYDLATSDDTSFEDFANWAADEVNKTSRKKAQDIYDDVTSLGEGDWSALNDFYCDTP
jgi:hypothetical protein